MSLPSLYNTFFFLKKYGNFSLTELDNLYPYELEIYYWMAYKAFKDEHDIK